MRLHSSILTPSDVHHATRAAGMRGVAAEVSSHGSRARARGLEVTLTGTSSRRPNSGNYGAGNDYAATWDEWGMVLAALFALDPEMIVGSPGRPTYASADAFHAATLDRYRNLTAPYQHGGGGHHWQSDGHGVRECTMCDAKIDQTLIYATPADVERALDSICYAERAGVTR